MWRRTRRRSGSKNRVFALLAVCLTAVELALNAVNGLAAWIDAKFMVRFILTKGIGREMHYDTDNFITHL